MTHRIGVDGYGKEDVLDPGEWWGIAQDAPRI
jgi:hypothetical protein